MSQNRHPSFRLERTIAHTTAKSPTEESTPSASACLPPKWGPALPAALATRVGSDPPSLSASAPRALQPPDGSASRGKCHGHVPDTKQG